MRPSLLLSLFLCIICNITYAQKMRLKSIQFGPTLAVQVERQDTTMTLMRQLVKEPQRFPKNSLDTLESSPARGWFFGSVTGVQASLLTAWEINADKKGKLGLQKEWRIGIEYSYLRNREEEWSSTDYTASSFDQVSFERQNHFMGLYTDFILKKGVARNRVTFFAGAGGYLAYSFSGRIVEKLSRGLYLMNTEPSVEKTYHATEPRRDIAILFPMGIDLRSANQRRPLGVSLGIRPGFMIVKEKNIASFVPGMIGFTARMVYQFQQKRD